MLFWDSAVHFFPEEGTNNPSGRLVPSSQNVDLLPKNMAKAMEEMEIKKRVLIFGAALSKRIHFPGCK